MVVLALLDHPRRSHFVIFTALSLMTRKSGSRGLMCRVSAWQAQILSNSLSVSLVRPMPLCLICWGGGRWRTALPKSGTWSGHGLVGSEDQTQASALMTRHGPRCAQKLPGPKFAIVSLERERAGH